MCAVFTAVTREDCVRWRPSRYFANALPVTRLHSTRDTPGRGPGRERSSARASGRGRCFPAGRRRARKPAREFDDPAAEALECVADRPGVAGPLSGAGNMRSEERARARRSVRSASSHGVRRMGMASGGPVGTDGRVASGMANSATVVTGWWQCEQSRVAVGSSGFRPWGCRAAGRSVGGRLLGAVQLD